MLKKAFILCSRILDVLPANKKWKIAKYFPSRFAFPFMQYSRTQVFNWDLGGNRFKLRSGPGDDYFRLSYQQEFTNWDHESISCWIESTRDSELAIDVGAYIGIYSLLASRPGGAKKLISVEPNSHAQNELEVNLRINKRLNVQIFKCALGNKPGSRLLRLPANRLNSSSVQIQDANKLFDISNWEVQEVMSMRLDDLVEDSHYKYVSSIKIDVEGLELEVLKSGTKLIANAHPRLLIEALSLVELLEIEEFLNQFGYSEGKALDGIRLNMIHNNATLNSSIAKNYYFE